MLDQIKIYKASKTWGMTIKTWLLPEQITGSDETSLAREYLRKRINIIITHHMNNR